MPENSNSYLEPRFYPAYAMKIDLEGWRQLSPDERASRGFTFSCEIRHLLLERVQLVHPTWSREQHEMMFFRLCYAGEHLERFAQAKISRGDWKAGEVQTVSATRIPFSRAEAEKYTAIFHPHLDENAKIWPSPRERGNHF